MNDGINIILNPYVNGKFYIGRFANILTFILYNIYKYLVVNDYKHINIYIIDDINSYNLGYINYGFLFKEEYVSFYNIHIKSEEEFNKIKDNYILNEFRFNKDADYKNEFLSYNYENFIKPEYYLNEKYNIIHIRLKDYLSENYKKIGYRTIPNREYIDNILNYLNIDESDCVLISDDIKTAKRIYKLENIKTLIYSSGKERLRKDFITLINSKNLIGSCSTFSIIGGLLGKNNKIFLQYPYLSIDENDKHNRNLDFLYNNDKVIKLDEFGNIIN